MSRLFVISLWAAAMLLATLAIAAPPGPERGSQREDQRQLWRDLKQGDPNSPAAVRENFSDATALARQEAQANYWRRYWHWYDNSYRPYYHSGPAHHAYSFPYRTPSTEPMRTPTPDFSY